MVKLNEELKVAFMGEEFKDCNVEASEQFKQDLEMYYRLIYKDRTNSITEDEVVEWNKLDKEIKDIKSDKVRKNIEWERESSGWEIDY